MGGGGGGVREIERGRQTDRQTDGGEAERERARETEREEGEGGRERDVGRGGTEKCIEQTECYIAVNSFTLCLLTSDSRKLTVTQYRAHFVFVLMLLSSCSATNGECNMKSLVF